MAQWHTASDGSRWRLEEREDRDILVVSFPSNSAAVAGISERVGKGLTLLETEDVGRIEARFRLPIISVSDLATVAQDLSSQVDELSTRV